MRNLGRLRLKHEWIILAMFVAQGLARGRVAGFQATSVGIIVWVVASVLLMSVLLPEWQRSGASLAWTGVGLNLIAVLVNNGMPVVVPPNVGSIAASASILRSLGFYQAVDRFTLGAAWGDILVARFGGAALALSAGDLLLVIGVVTIIVGACLEVGDLPEGERSSAMEHSGADASC